MKFLTLINKTVQMATGEPTTPARTCASELFEQYTREHLFTGSDYSLLHHTHRYTANTADYTRSSLNPDYQFFDKQARKDFWLEVKFLPEEYGGRVHWCTDDQLLRYQACHKRVPVFIVMGIGGQPDAPGQTALLSLTVAKHHVLTDALVEQFRIPPTVPVESAVLWAR